MTTAPQGLTRHDRCAELINAAYEQHQKAVEAAIVRRREARTAAERVPAVAHDMNRRRLVALRFERPRTPEIEEEIAELEAKVLAPWPQLDHSAAEAEFAEAVREADEKYRNAHAAARRARDDGLLG